jgi:hypothetical protein
LSGAPLSLLLLVAVLILVTEHSGHTHALREYIEMVWAVMVLGLILVLILNDRVTADEVRIRCTPVGIFPPRTLDRSAIVSVHHWSFWRKGWRYRLAIQLAFPVSLTPLATREEVRVVAEPSPSGFKWTAAKRRRTGSWTSPASDTCFGLSPVWRLRG